MKVRLLNVRNFRGVKECTWHVDRRLVALVGAGDSTKTTLLDALGLVLSPTYSPQFTDADFYGCSTAEPISIEAAITELPDHLVQESQFGKDRSGIAEDGTLVHDPVEGVEECLLLRLTVTEELEPKWEVVRPSDDIGRPISGTQRARLGFSRVGERVDVHLRWARTSALTGLTENRTGLPSVILAAQREARRAVFDAAPEHLNDAAALARSAALKLGSAAFGPLRPGLEPTAASSAHSLMLHDADVPLTSFGLGTRRLTSLSIQDQAVAGGAIVAIDEVEHGLEPHRLAHVLRYLKDRAKAGDIQVILTTHSPVAVETLQAVDLGVVRSVDGQTFATSVSPELDNIQGVVRSAPSALLSRRIVVGEGPTEVGFVRGLLRRLDAGQLERNAPTTATLGVAIVDGGGGDQAIKRGSILRELGYPTAVLIDNDDRTIDSAVSAAQLDRLDIRRWGADLSLEDQIARDIDEVGLRAVVELAADIRSEDAVTAGVAARLGVDSLTGLDPAAWAAVTGKPLDEVRAAIGYAAKGRKLDGESKDESKGWFKREDAGEQLAAVVVEHWEAVKDSDLGAVIGALLVFALADEPQQRAVDGDGTAAGT